MKVLGKIFLPKWLCLCLKKTETKFRQYYLNLDHLKRIKQFSFFSVSYN